MPNATSPLVEQRVVAFALGQPGLGPARIAAELAQPRWGGFKLSPNGVWRVLRRHGLSTRAKRLTLITGYAAPPEPQRPEPREPAHLDVQKPGELVQMDCFYIGRLSGTQGTVWQYTAIDVASAYVWAELHLTPKNPSARKTSVLPWLAWTPNIASSTPAGRRPTAASSGCSGRSWRSAGSRPSLAT